MPDHDIAMDDLGRYLSQQDRLADLVDSDRVELCGCRMQLEDGTCRIHNYKAALTDNAGMCAHCAEDVCPLFNDGK